MIILSQSIEIEFKNLLTLDEFNTIKTHFGISDSDFFQQENHYFDTAKFELKENNAALRIRKKANHYELTLKQTVADGLLETTQILNEPDVQLALSENRLPQGQVSNLIVEMNIDPASLQFFGTLTTNRTELDYMGGILVLDHSYYLNKEDFELEYEVTERMTGEKTFLAILQFFQIPVRQTKNKIFRFYQQKYQQFS
jgi:uncharacterized protein YjbK